MKNNIFFIKILPILAFIIFFGFFINNKIVFAASSVISTEYKMSSSQHYQGVVGGIVAALTCQLSGINQSNLNFNCSNDSVYSFDKYGNGAIAAMSNLMKFTFSMPVSSAQYALYLKNSFGFAKPVYAQVQGIDQLSPLLNIWKAARNLVYLLFVLIFILIGLGIMFRLKLDPRTVMTVQNQIPRIVVGLVLITFSYAIAGFLVDMMWLLLYSFYIVLAKIPGVDLSNINVSNIQTISPLGAPSDIMNIGIGGIAGKAFSAVGSTLDTLFNGGFLSFLSRIIGQPLAYIIVLVAVLWSLFRLWWQLIYNYILILVDVIIAPFWIGIGLLPGSKTGFGGWLRDLAASLSVYPTTFLMFLLGRVLIGAFSNGGSAGFVPPLIGGINVNDAFSVLVGLGVIFSLPSVVELVRQALKAPSIKLPASIGQAVGVGAAVPGRLVGGSVQTGLAPHYTAEGKLVYPGGPFGRVLRGFGLVK